MTRFWLAFTTPPQKERAAEEDLRERGFRAKVPMMQRRRCIRGRVSLVSVPALRGYVFVQSPEHLFLVLATKHINRVVGFNGRPGLISGEVMEDFVMKLEQPEAVTPEFQLRPGDNVTINAGAFAQLPGIIKGIEGSTARVLVELFGRSCETKVSLIQLELIDTASLKTSSREKRRLQGTRKSGMLHAG